MAFAIAKPRRHSGCNATIVVANRRKSSGDRQPARQLCASWTMALKEAQHCCGWLQCPPNAQWEQCRAVQRALKQVPRKGAQKASAQVAIRQCQGRMLKTACDRCSCRDGGIAPHQQLAPDATTSHCWSRTVHANNGLKDHCQNSAITHCAASETMVKVATGKTCEHSIDMRKVEAAHPGNAQGQRKHSSTECLKTVTLKMWKRCSPTQKRSAKGIAEANSENTEANSKNTKSNLVQKDSTEHDKNMHVPNVHLWLKKFMQVIAKPTLLGLRVQKQTKQ